MPLAVDFQGGLTSAWSNVITFVPKLAAALLIILVGYLIAKVVAGVLNKVLERVGFDRAVERGGVKQALARSKYDPSDIIAKLAFWLIFLVSLQIAFGVFGPNPISDLLQGLIAYLPNVFVAILIIVVAAAIAKAVTDLLLQRALERLRRAGHGQGGRDRGAGLWGVRGPGPAADRPPDRDRPVVRDPGHRGRLGGGRHRRRRDQDHAALLGAGHHHGRSSAPPSSSSRPSSPPLMTATVRRSTPSRRPRSSRPSGPAGYAGTARPSRRRDASTGHRAEASRPPTNQPSHT